VECIVCCELTELEQLEVSFGDFTRFDMSRIKGLWARNG
jgi:hypothetical protein